MNEAIVKAAAEKFEAVVREQLERVERMKAEKILWIMTLLTSLSSVYAAATA